METIKKKRKESSQLSVLSPAPEAGVEEDSKKLLGSCGSEKNCARAARKGKL